MYACNAFKPVRLGQSCFTMKQHLYRKLGLYLNREETEKVRKINGNLIKLFGRRHINPEDYYEDYNMDKNII